MKVNLHYVLRYTDYYFQTKASPLLKGIWSMLVKNSQQKFTLTPPHPPNLLPLKTPNNLNTCLYLNYHSKANVCMFWVVFVWFNTNIQGADCIICQITTWLYLDWHVITFLSSLTKKTCTHKIKMFQHLIFFSSKQNPWPIKCS